MTIYMNIYLSLVVYDYHQFTSIFQFKPTTSVVRLWFVSLKGRVIVLKVLTTKFDLTPTYIDDNFQIPPEFSQRSDAFYAHMLASKNQESQSFGLVYICHESNNLTTMPNFFVNYIQNTSKTSLSVIIDPIHIRFAMSYGIGCTWSSKSIKVAYNTCNVIDLGSIQGEKIKYTNLTHKKSSQINSKYNMSLFIV